MKLYRAKTDFNCKFSGTPVLKGQTFIVEGVDDLPHPSVDQKKDVYEEIKPKNLLIKLDNFVKATDI